MNPSTLSCSAVLAAPFCAGGDLGAIGKGRERNETAELGPILRSGMQAVLKMRLMPQPVDRSSEWDRRPVAGMNVALAADIRIAADSATFGQNFFQGGIVPRLWRNLFAPGACGAFRCRGNVLHRGHDRCADRAAARQSSAGLFQPPNWKPK